MEVTAAPSREQRTRAYVYPAAMESFLPETVSPTCPASASSEAVLLVSSRSARPSRQLANVIEIPQRYTEHRKNNYSFDAGSRDGEAACTAAILCIIIFITLHGRKHLFRRYWRQGRIVVAFIIDYAQGFR